MTNARNGADYPPIPPSSVLDDWKVKNDSQPFDEEAALCYLARNEQLFAERFASVIDSALGSIQAPKKP